MSEEVPFVPVQPKPGDTVASLVREGRKRIGISQRALAERTGCAQSLVSLLEKGHAPPRGLVGRTGAHLDVRYRKIARVLGIDVDAFVMRVSFEQGAVRGMVPGKTVLGSSDLPSHNVRENDGGLQTFMDTYEPGREGYCLSVGSVWWRMRSLIPAFSFECLPYPERLPADQCDRVLTRRMSLRESYRRTYVLLRRVVVINNAMSDIDMRVAHDALPGITELLGSPGTVIDVRTINRAYYALAFRLAAMERSLAHVDTSSGLLAYDLAVLADATAV